MKGADVITLSTQLDEIPRGVAWVMARAPTWVDPGLLELGLTEAITNALVHGVLGVTSDGREEDLSAYLDEVRRRSLAPPSSRRGGTVTLKVLESGPRMELLLAWTGTPCPPEARQGKLPNTPSAGGMGQGIIEAVFSDVIWAEDGLSQRLVVLPPAAT